MSIGETAPTVRLTPPDTPAGGLPVPTPDPAPAPDVPPAALVPPPGRWERFGWYAGAVALTAGLLAAGLRLDQLDLRAPLYYDQDALLILPLVKAVVERGPVAHWRNDRIGYPGVQELYDFPIVDHLHFLAVWLLGLVVPDWVVVYNLYFLLTWPLTTLTAMWAFRRLGLTLPLAAVGGLLYAFLPYHFLRGNLGHYFLVAYWLVPLSTLPALAVCRGDLPFFRRRAGGGYGWALGTRAAGAEVLLGLATSAAGGYYAFFACVLYCAAGAYGWAVLRTWKAAASAGLLAAVVTAGGLAQHLPTFAHVARYGANSATARIPDEADTYGLRVAQLVLPVDGHRLPPLARLKAGYNSGERSLVNENGSATLGAVGSAGLLVLVGAVLLPGRRGWPLGPAAALAGFILLFSTIGGLGSLFNLLVIDQIRCLNRFSVYLAVLCLLAVLWPVDRFLAGRSRRVRYGGAAALAAVGLADQTPGDWFGPAAAAVAREEADRWEADRRFFARVEGALPADARVLPLPYMPYPEVPPRHRLNAYEHARGYVHAGRLVWGYGAIKNRSADEWLRSVGHEPPHQLLRRAVARGFDAALVDGRGFATTRAANQFLDDLRAAAHPVLLPEVIHDDGRQFVLDLRGYRDWLRGLDPAQFAVWEREEAEFVALTWLRGTYTFRPLDPGTAYRPGGRSWAYRWLSRDGLAVVDNPTGRTRRFRLSAGVGTDHGGEFVVRVDGPGLVWADRPGGPGPWRDEFAVERRERPAVRAWVLEVPPGRHRVRITCTPPPGFLPHDSRPLLGYLKDVTFVEIK